MKIIINILVLLLVSISVYAEVLFEDDFNSQDDWETLSETEVGELPDGWIFGRTTDNWHPNTISGSNASMSINGNNSTQNYGGDGKSFISYSESLNDMTNNGFTSDGFISTDISPSNQVYVQFKLKFQPDFASNIEDGQIKLFRIAHYDGEGSRSDFFSDGKNAPLYLFDWSQSEYGVRHFHAFRCDDQETNYYCINPKIETPPREVNTGDMSTNFTSHVENSVNIVDKLNGGFLPEEGLAFHKQVYGDSWNTLEFFFKLNTSPGTNDGIFKFWLNGIEIVDMDKIAWIGSDGDITAKWNTVGIGGNDRYHFNLDVNAEVSDRERWYAIDNFLVLDSLPTAPKSPTNLLIY